mgnify:CR=1 FL=1
MNKKWKKSVIIVIIVGLVVGIGYAIYSENKNKTDNMDIISKKELAKNLNMIENNNIENIVNSVETSIQDNKISPNAMITKKIYYQECDHLIRKNEDIPEELVNKTEENVKEMFPNWNIEEYSPTQIILYKTSSENCGEHYFVQEHNGVIGIYTTDKYGVKTFKEDTEIPTQYLPETDIENLKAGIEIIGYTKLVEFLEDYE